MLIKAGGRKPLEISNLLLDFNGTLAQNGLIGGDAKKLVDIIAQDMKVYVATADTRGNAAKECSGLPVELLELPSGMPEDEAKLQLLEKIGADTTIAFGFGALGFEGACLTLIGFIKTAFREIAIPGLIGASFPIGHGLSCGAGKFVFLLIIGKIR